MPALSNATHPDLLAALDNAYTPHGLRCSEILKDELNREYGAYTFRLNTYLIKFRVAKITPKKSGQFVAFYKRDELRVSVPYAQADQFDFLVVSVRNDEQIGQFIFPKTLLCQKGFLSHREQVGKRAMRVYPPWDKPGSEQARSTQAWQLAYYVTISPNASIHCDAFNRLLCKTSQSSSIGRR